MTPASVANVKWNALYVNLLLQATSLVQPEP